MLRVLVAPAREQLAFSDCPTQPLAPDQVRVRSLFGAAKHGTEMAMYKGYAAPRGGYDGAAASRASPNTHSEATQFSTTRATTSAHSSSKSPRLKECASSKLQPTGVEQGHLVRKNPRPEPGERHYDRRLPS